MKRTKLVMFSLAVLFLAMTWQTAEAGQRGHRYRTYGRGYGVRSHYAPLYHPPSMHYDSAYHVESYHWTPWQGLHTHGHYDLVPHYTPGHFDYGHGGHIHFDRRFHH